MYKYCVDHDAATLETLQHHSRPSPGHWVTRSSAGTVPHQPNLFLHWSQPAQNDLLLMRTRRSLRPSKSRQQPRGWFDGPAGRKRKGSALPSNVQKIPGSSAPRAKRVFISMRSAHPCRRDDAAQEHSATGGFRGHENATNCFEINIFHLCFHLQRWRKATPLLCFMALATGPLSEQLVSPGHADLMAISIHFGVHRDTKSMSIALPNPGWNFTPAPIFEPVTKLFGRCARNIRPDRRASATHSAQAFEEADCKKNLQMASSSIDDGSNKRVGHAICTCHSGQGIEDFIRISFGRETNNPPVKGFGNHKHTVKFNFPVIRNRQTAKDFGSA